MNRGYWVTPDGEIIDLGTKHHIDIVIDSPGQFGENLEDIKEAYERFGEGWRFEGKARDEIMQRVVRIGFIRIREVKNYWKIQLWGFNSDQCHNLSSWAKVIASQKRDMYGDARIMDISRHPLRWEYFTIKELQEIEVEFKENCKGAAYRCRLA